MAIVLKKLVSSGPSKPDAEIRFNPLRTLIRGPSDTGKSYVRDCLWYCLGGNTSPKTFPEMEGYDLLTLEFSSESHVYQIVRALAGGGSSVYRVDALEKAERELLEVDEGELLVELAGAAGRLLLRSLSKKGGVTGGDLRHWSLLSQPGVISEDPTSGVSQDKIQRIAAFNLFLTGSDDEAIQLTKSTAEVERIKGKLSSAQDSLQRVRAGLYADITRTDVEDSFSRVDETLTAMTSQYEARAASLREVRAELADLGSSFRKASAQRQHSASMLQRFELLSRKYASDLGRLGATSEGVSFFEALEEVPCPLCGTPGEKQLDPAQLKPNAPKKYREALTAEAQKIRALRMGLETTVGHERERLRQLEDRTEALASELKRVERKEAQIVNSTRVEFSADPKTLAHRHSELTAQLGIFDEIERLTIEIENLKKLKVRKRGVPVSRDSGLTAASVADLAKEFLHAWGFIDIQTVELDAEECDLRLNGRSRLSFGAGRRAIFLTALFAALLRHSLSQGFPHLGVAVIDSPLKAYADPKQPYTQDIPASTVTENFYLWLSKWSGPGQLIIIENEKILANTAALLTPIEFTKSNQEGRAGFYPRTVSSDAS